jgi:DNA-directed RNA polymerase subunit RPC12/RpoP
MTSRNIRCPKCSVAFGIDPAAEKLVCPSCGSKFTLTRKPATPSSPDSDSESVSTAYIDRLGSGARSSSLHRDLTGESSSVNVGKIHVSKKHVGLILTGLGALLVVGVLAIGTLAWFLFPGLNETAIVDNASESMKPDKKAPPPTATPGFVLVAQRDPEWVKPEKPASPLGLRASPPFDPIKPVSAQAVFQEENSITQRRRFVAGSFSLPKPVWKERSWDMYQPPTLASTATTGWPVTEHPRSHELGMNLADLNGPFMIVWPPWVIEDRSALPCKYDLLPLKQETKPSTEPSKKPNSKKKSAQPPPSDDPEPVTYREPVGKDFEVIDLRSGKAAYRYGYRTPVGMGLNLSPDGKLIVGTYDPFSDLEKSYPTFAKLADTPSQPSPMTLMVMEPDNRHPSGWIPIEGTVVWMSFVSARKLAVLEANPKTMLKFWDLAEPSQPKLIASVRPTGSQLFDSNDYTERSNGSKLESNFGAAVLGKVPCSISPNGRLIAVVHHEGASIIDSETHENIGVVRSEIKSMETTDLQTPHGFKKVQFSQDGSLLYGLGGGRLVAWRMSDGAQTINVRDSVGADLFVEGTEPSTLIYPSFTSQEFSASVMSTIGGLEFKLIETYPLVRWKDAHLAMGTHAQAPTGTPLWPSDKNAYPFVDTKKYKTTIWVRPNEPISTAPIPEASKLAFTPISVCNPDLIPNNALPEEWQQPAVRKADQYPPKLKSSSTFPALLSVFNRNEGALLKYGPQFKTFRSVLWHRFDRNTGAPIGQPIEVTPVESFSESTPKWLIEKRVIRHSLFALHPTEPKLVYEDLQIPGAFRIVDAESGSNSTFRCLEMTGCESMFWPTSNRIVFVQDGSIYGFDPTTQKMIFKRTGQYVPITDWAHHRSWFAVWNEKQAELIDIENGACITVCRSGDAEGTIAQMRVAPDDSQLAAIFSMPNAENTRTENRCVVWNLTDGNAQTVVFGHLDKAFAKSVEWLTPDHVCVTSATSSLDLGLTAVYDLKSKIKLGDILAYSNHTVTNLETLSAGQWIGPRSNDLLSNTQPLRLQAADWKVSAIELPKSARIRDAKDIPVCIEVDFEGDLAASQAMANNFAKSAVAQGWELGGGGYRLKVQLVRSESKDPQQVIRSGFSTIPYKAFSMKMELIDAKGTKIHDRESQLVWDSWSSKYRTKRETISVKDDPRTSNMPAGGRDKIVTTMTEYDFKGDIGECMFAELKEPWLRPTASLLLPIPTGVEIETEHGKYPYPLVFQWQLVAD